ncbi:MAG: hypothetical protein KTR33_14050 [Gammaproteobacteria bacterium]|nr:hypothetical protein [Gammaproteobacteria bacterium]
MNQKVELSWEDQPVNIKFKISALWVTMLFVFAYVDIFGFFRADVLGDAMAGRVSVFAVSQSFLLFTTIYILIPSAMVFLSLVLRPSINRTVNIALAVIYALSIVLACLDEQWLYFIVGSVIEIVILGMIARYAWNWPRQSIVAATGQAQNASA